MAATLGAYVGLPPRQRAGPGHGDGNFLNVSERNANYFLEEPLKNGGV